MFYLFNWIFTKSIFWAYNRMNKKYAIILLLLIFIVLAIGLFMGTIREGVNNWEIHNDDINDNITTRSIGSTLPIPYGYYIISSDSVAKTNKITRIPHGYISNDGGKTIEIKTNSAAYAKAYNANAADIPLSPDSVANADVTQISKNIRYDVNNIPNYHDDYQGDPAELQQVKGNTTYYEPGTYIFGPSSYVPNYEDSVYLSSTTGQSTVMPVYNIAAMAVGFCAQNQHDKIAIEQNCNALDPNTCESTSCCVLLGGQKCVAGSVNGPNLKTNYSDVLVQNKDSYYYQGKCYGNCTGSINYADSATSSWESAYV